jgi:hypothetical protein
MTDANPYAPPAVSPARNPGSLLKTWCHVVALPTVWLVSAIISSQHPGDEYGLFFGLSCPHVLWLALAAEALLGSSNPGSWEVLAPFLFAGFCELLAISWLLTRCNVTSLWIKGVPLPAILIGSLLITQHDSVAAAIAKNGSLTEYVSASLCAAIVGSAVLILVVAGTVRLICLTTRRHPRT